MLAQAQNAAPTQRPAAQTRHTVTTFSRRKRPADDDYEFIGDARTPAAQRPRHEPPALPACLPPVGVAPSSEVTTPAWQLRRVDTPADFQGPSGGRLPVRVAPTPAQSLRANDTLTGHYWPHHHQRAPAPAGMPNLGNTCYLNAVLQALLGLPTFPADLRRAATALGSHLPPSGIVATLVKLAAAREAGSTCVSPAAVRQAVIGHAHQFQNQLQHDAHEFLCALLEGGKEEVLRVESARLGRPKIRASETVDPCTRCLGLAMQLEMICTKCGTSTSVTEHFSHLSLDLPTARDTPPGLQAMLASYFEADEVEKACETCHMNVKHRACRRISRLSL